MELSGMSRRNRAYCAAIGAPHAPHAYWAIALLSHHDEEAPYRVIASTATGYSTCVQHVLYTCVITPES